MSFQESSVRREFGYGSALLIATVVHVAIALLLHYNNVNAAVPPPQPPPQPLQIRFVKVPQESMPMMPESGTPHPAAGSPRASAPAAAPRMAQNSPPARRTPAPSVQPQTPDMTQDTQQEQRPDIAIPATRGRVQDYPDLATSLQHLDRYISSGSSGGGNNGGRGGNGNGGPGQDDSAAGAYFDTQGYDLGPWGDQVVALVRRNWSIPPAADLGMKGIVGIAFNVDRNGHLEDIRIISSSGIPSFDQAAVNALRISDPFVPLPSDFPRPKLPAVFRFFYNVPVPSK